MLKGNKLYYLENQHEPPHGVIGRCWLSEVMVGSRKCFVVLDLKDCLTVKSAEDKTNKKFCFEVATPLVSVPSILLAWTISVDVVFGCSRRVVLIVREY